MFEIIKPGKNIDFMGKRKFWVVFSVVTSLGSIALFATKGLNYGIDFTGGAEIQVKAPKTWDISKLRDGLEKGGVKDAKVQQIGMEGEHTFLVKVQGDEKSLNETSQKVDAILTAEAGKGTYELQRVDVVGPAAGESLRTSGFLSMLYAFVSILIYITIRFDMRYGPGAILSLVHDTIITLGIYCLLGKQFDLQILAALLALIGYSINDTIIVYDRVRETLHDNPGMAIVDAVNKSINDTLGRTILTSFLTFLSVFALWVFGGSVIENFAFTLMVGIVIGTYSSIFVASALVVYFTERQQRRAREGKMGKRKTYSVPAEPKFQ